ncbi:MAG: RNA ligase family protein [Burkholderiales bacterium]|nr:RNA ligase family protein [Burkholderiales bacterium]
MSDFFRFPHTQHLFWLGHDTPRNDKVLTQTEVAAMLLGDVVVEEKLDGANVGFSLSLDGGLRVQNRGQYLTAMHAGQFLRLPEWMAQHSEGLYAALKPNLVLFGEWCAARHSLDYDALSDWFFLFDVYDRIAGRFWSSPRRNALACMSGLVTVPQVLQGKVTVSTLTQLVVTVPSHFRQGALEGVVIRRESTDWCDARAKLVRPDFAQTIDTHWRTRSIEWNRLDYAIGAQSEPNGMN